MPFKITTVDTFKWPNDSVVVEQLKIFETDVSELEERIKRDVFEGESGRGFIGL